MKNILVGVLCAAAAWGLGGAFAETPEDTVTLHVAPGGDDAHSGTADEPLETIQAAQEAVRALLAEDNAQAIEVQLNDGVYRIEEPLNFGPADSPGEGGEVIWRAAPDAKPLISGGRAIGGWEANGDGTYSTVVEAVRDGEWTFHELFVNGERRYRARFPGKGFSRIVEAGEDRRTNFTFHDGDIPEEMAGDLADTGLELVFFHDWSITRVPVERIDHEENRLYVVHPIGQQAGHYRIDHFESNPRYYIENHRALLDTPGEWHLDEATGELTYWPKSGETMDEAEVTAPVSKGLLNARGAEDDPIRGLTFKDIHFAHSAWDLPAGGYAGGQATIHEDRYEEDHPGRAMMSAAITFDFAEHNTITGGSIRNVGHSGLWLRRECSHNTISGLVVDDVGGNAVNIGETRARQVNGASWTQAAPEQAGQANRIKDSVLQRTGRIDFSGIGVWVGMAADTEVRHNLVRQTPYTGVSVGWMWNSQPTPCEGTLVEANHIHHVMQVLSDGGGVYSLGYQPGATLRDNLIHDVPLNLGRAESNGMFLDEGTMDLTIEDNVIYNVDRSPLRFHRAEENLVRNNLLVIADEDTPMVRYNATPEENIELVNNDAPTRAEFDPDTVAGFRERAGPRTMPEDIPDSADAFALWAEDPE
ncbi:MAG: right-handed parallel beta-helix repeat-containing protein [Candidatus Hydrogenedentota bacterium]